MRSAARLAGLIAMILGVLVVAENRALSQVQADGAGKKAAKSEKKLEKEAAKLERKADEASERLGRNVVFCILAAHTEGVGTGPELRAKFESLSDFPFGRFVAAVLMADRTDIPLDEILTKLSAGMKLGRIAAEAGVSMGELRREFGAFRSELARSLTNPPTRDCFQTE